MTNICELPYYEIEIDKAGRLVDPLSISRIQDLLQRQGQATRHLFVIAHGWNSNIPAARGLYEYFFTQFSKTLKAYAAPGVSARQCAVLGILWPSEKFTDAALIPGGAASLVRDPRAQREFVHAALSGLSSQPDDEGTHCLFGMEGDELLDLLSRVTRDRDVEGGAAGMGDRMAGMEHAIARLLNATTYYLMKDRAGIVGRGAVASSLAAIQRSFPDIRVHLAGHSFGCRLITAAAATISQPVASMTLLQAAFSHNSFSPGYDFSHHPGGFRNVVTERKCEGPMLITHSVQDEAVGVAYPIASRILGQNASSIGGANDLYGALGHNGAQHTPEASDDILLDEGASYSFAPRRIYNLRADHIIQAHCDIVKPQTAWALIAAAGLGRHDPGSQTIQSSE
jgi:pimeloyl-ACP methyl ester carboxylesterase